jgi:tRNA 2-thiouridine synthesizing protein A
MAEPHILDAKGLKCPLPVLRARKAMKEVPPGGTLIVLATDPGAPKDFEAFARATGHALVSSTEVDGVYTFELKRAAS